MRFDNFLAILIMAFCDPILTCNSAYLAAKAYNEKQEIIYKDESDVEHTLVETTPVSMNMWGFTPDYFELATRESSNFLLYKLDFIGA